jgi:hypothetical protein
MLRLINKPVDQRPKAAKAERRLARWTTISFYAKLVLGCTGCILLLMLIPLTLTQLTGKPAGGSDSSGSPIAAAIHDQHAR